MSGRRNSSACTSNSLSREAKSPGSVVSRCPGRRGLYYYPPTSCFLEKIFFKSTLLCRLSEAQAWGGFTWGYSWCHLYEVGVALRSFWPSGRRLEVFLHAIRLFRLNSQKNDRPNRESACNPIPTNNNHTQKFPYIPRVQWLQQQPKKQKFRALSCFFVVKKIGCGR
jgi:hypothetical protein